MDGAWPEPAQGIDMLRSTVAFMFCESVFRIEAIVFETKPVAGDLGKDAGGGNRAGARVPSDHRICGERKIACHISINQSEIGCRGERLHGTAHGQHVRIEDIERIDLFGRSRRDGISKRILADTVKERVSPFFGELFGIVEPRDQLARRQNAGGGKDGSGKRAAYNQA